MESKNLKFQIFFLDSRPIEDLCRSLDEVFGGKFEQDLEYKANARLKFSNYVFGLNILLLKEEEWPEGNVYFLTGANDHFCRSDTPDVLNLDFHVQKLIATLEFKKVMSFEEFREESLKRE